MEKNEAIEKAMMMLDFKKIRGMMMLMDHQWSGKNGMYYPEEDHMNNVVWSMLNKVYDRKEESYSMAQGGFHVVKVSYGLTVFFAPSGFSSKTF